MANACGKGQFYKVIGYKLGVETSEKSYNIVILGESVSAKVCSIGAPAGISLRLKSFLR